MPLTIPVTFLLREGATAGAIDALFASGGPLTGLDPKWEKPTPTPAPGLTGFLVPLTPARIEELLGPVFLAEAVRTDPRQDGRRETYRGWLFGSAADPDAATACLSPEPSKPLGKAVHTVALPIAGQGTAGGSPHRLTRRLDQARRARALQDAAVRSLEAELEPEREVGYRVDSPSQADGTGSGVIVALVDSGITHRTRELVEVVGGRIRLTHPALDKPRVWVPDGSFLGDAVRDDRVLPVAGDARSWEVKGVQCSVRVAYAFVPEAYRQALGDRHEEHAVPHLDPHGDEDGHGTMVASVLLQAAPGITLWSFKYCDNSTVRSYPAQALLLAAEHDPRPDVIVCPWVLLGHCGDAREASVVDAAIDTAVARGITVLFGAGNGHTDQGCGQSVAHPDIISVGGGTYTQALQLAQRDVGVVASAGPWRLQDILERLDRAGAGGNGGGDGSPVGIGSLLQWVGEGLVAADLQPLAALQIIQATTWASAFKSARYPGRTCPDVVQGVGGHRMPTWPFSRADQATSRQAGDERDGWATDSGTSMSVALVAGVVARLIEGWRASNPPRPALTPHAIQNILENSAEDLDAGTAGKAAAAPGYDMATGWGLSRANAARSYLVDGARPFIRDQVDQRGGEGPTEGRVDRSPDIVVLPAGTSSLRGEPVGAYLGLRTKHRRSTPIRRAAARGARQRAGSQLWLRLQNRGDQPWSGPITVWLLVDGKPVTDATLRVPQLESVHPPLPTAMAQALDGGRSLLPGEFLVGQVPHSALDLRRGAGRGAAPSTVDVVVRLGDAPAPPRTWTTSVMETWVREHENIAWRRILGAEEGGR